jgi:hypothetical protein
MKLLAVEKGSNDLSGDGFSELLKEEAHTVWNYYKLGIIRDIYFSLPEHKAVIIMECANKLEASQLLSELPLVKANLINFDLFELAAYDGFERLFKITSEQDL